jgi:hypothetical protein
MADQKFEVLFQGLVNETSKGRIGRISYNQEMMDCSLEDAMAIDDAQTKLVEGIARLVGFTLDSLAGLQKSQKGLQGMALARLLQGVELNVVTMRQFCQATALTSMTSEATGCPFVVNPNNPDCDCENCQLARALNDIMVGGD